MPNVLRVQDTSNSLKELLAHSAEIGKNRMKGRNAQRPKTVSASSQSEEEGDENQIIESEEDEGEEVDLATRYNIPRPERTDWSKAARPPARTLTQAELQQQAVRRRTLQNKVLLAQQPEDDDDEEEPIPTPISKITFQ